MDSSRPHELGILNFSNSSLSLGSQTLMQTLLYSFSTQVTLLYIYLFMWMTVLSQVPTPIIQRYIDLLEQRFSIKDLGALSYFLSIEVLTTPSGVLLTQMCYISDLLAQTKMSGAKFVATPLVKDGNLTLHSSTALTNCTEYRALLVVYSTFALLAQTYHMLLTSYHNSYISQHLNIGMLQNNCFNICVAH